MTATTTQGMPGFIAVFFDIPFPTSIPNGTYPTLDPVKGVAVVTLTLREGTRAFFRNRPISGPTSFRELQHAWQEPERPRQEYDYLAVNNLHDGRKKATLNVHTGKDGGYAECKYYSEICVTYLSDDLESINLQNASVLRACEILNPFLDKYRLLNQDYRVSSVSSERNFYFATCHTSPLQPEELGLSVPELFDRLQKPRTFRAELGHGAANIFRLNSFELLGPRTPIVSPTLDLFAAFIRAEYTMPLSYELVLDALGYLQRLRDYRLAIVQSETAVEVHVRHLLVKLMTHYGTSKTDADATIDNDDKYWGVKRKIRRLDDWTAKYCTDLGLAYAAFLDSALYKKWDSELYGRRNAAVHEGAAAFTYDQASVAIGVSKECIIQMEARVPGLQNQVQLDPSMSSFRLNPGEVMF